MVTTKEDLARFPRFFARYADRLEALKAMFYAVNKVNAENKDCVAAYQVWPITKQLNSGDFLLLMTFNENDQHFAEILYVQWIAQLTTLAGFTALSSPNLGDPTKRALAVLVFDCYFDLRRGGQFDAYAQLLASAISVGKPHSKTNRDYRACLLKIFEKERHEFLITRPEKRLKDLGIAIGFKEEKDWEPEDEDELEP